MKKPAGFLRIFGAVALVVGLLAATMAPVMAQEDGDVGSQDWLDQLIGVDGAGFLAGNNTIFYPWVANDDDFGLGAADTSISVQNLEDVDTVISIFVGNGAGGFDLVTSAFLAAYAAKTFSAEMLGIAEGDGAPVMVASFNSTPFSEIPGFPDAPSGTIALVETPVILSNPIAADEDGGESTQVVACVVNFHTAAQPDLGQPFGYVAAVDHTFVGDAGDVELVAGEWFTHAFTQQELQNTLNAANAGDPELLINPFGGLNNDGDCFDVLDAVTGELEDSVAIGGVAKQAVDGEALPATSEVDTAVSGYNALNGVEIAYFDEWYLPIVQTNCGPGGCWDSMLRVANVDFENNAVTVRFFPADDGSGSLQTGFQVEALVNGGDTWHINLGDLVPEGWVGSAHILSDGAVFAMVDRYKVGYNMWITNTGSSADFENLAQVDNAQGRYALFAPHVLLDYFGWNTGINVANLAGEDNNISIQYFNLFGNATEVLNQRLAAHGMTYFYDPSVGAQNISEQDVTTDPNAGVVGSAIIWSDLPVAAAVDATKYPETDPTGGADLFQATSYSATANVFPWQAVPLVQKGSAIDGMGDTSGINIMNPNAVAATANVYYVNPSGFNAQNFGTSSVTIPAFANGFVYTLWQHNLPNGFTGAAQVIADQPVVAVSANVNYEVNGDGSAIFNAFNPCGLYRVAGPCTFGDVFEPGGQSVTKTFIEDDGDEDNVLDGDEVGIAGVNFSIVNTSGAAYQRDGVSGTDGSMIFTNVPVGTYELVINSVPAGYVLPEDFVETFTVTEGEDVVLVNRLAAEVEGFTKTVVVAEVNGEDDGLTDITLEGVNVIVYAQNGTEAGGAPVLGAGVFEGVTGADGKVSGNLVAGDYVLCLWSDTGFATTSDDTVVGVDLPNTAAEACAFGLDTFTIGDDDNGPVELLNGVFVFGLQGDLIVNTAVEGGSVGSIPVAVYVLAEGETCDDVTLGVDDPLVSGTTNVGGQEDFPALDAGLYCVVADFDVNWGLILGEVRVEAEATAEIWLDAIFGAQGMFDVLIQDVYGDGDPAPSGEGVQVCVNGDCQTTVADDDGMLSFLLTSGDYTISVGGTVAGDFYVSGATGSASTTVDGTFPSNIFDITFDSSISVTPDLTIDIDNDLL